MTTRPAVESTQRLDRHRWKVERSIACLTGYRRLSARYERNTGHYCAFLTPAAALTCYKYLARLTACRLS